MVITIEIRDFAHEVKMIWNNPDCFVNWDKETVMIKGYVLSIVDWSKTIHKKKETIYHLDCECIFPIFEELYTLKLKEHGGH